MTKGKLIIIESGSDASGKATQAKKLYERLLEEGYNIKKITYPNYDSPACMPVKMYLSGEFGNKPEDVNAYVASTFFAIDRFASYNKEWKEFYDNGGIIISDRYTTSNMVHQAVKMDEEEKDKYLDWLYNLEFNLYKLPVPDCVMFLDVLPEISQKLMKDRNNKFTGEKEKDIHENNKDYLAKSYYNSLEIAERYNWDKIKCNDGDNLKTIEEIHEEIYKKVKNYI
ncbi:UNVERIFIED_ORG: thymidylate kinase [Clostridium botulinum]|uniref:Thymidylate kinase n=2 Tax=Clostridium botulinum TaxID=1491 RepID=A0A0C2SH66_CLOBO|nr:thymidylate kinase [Clostridium botulinum]ACD51390.1 thymidylate kinase [Clostridium botulinum E3 str. Alaska E43]AJF28290.1 thymidylate kinase [Clostridium botulinum]AJF31350.1 thymidylate kinase [Clostridium botulinum]KIL08501.1 thymidylate kinase [Clostridium botulinum]KOM89660.1 thymidylate kinase [Clostridium botulinum]